MPWRLRRSCYLTQLASRFVLRLVSQQCTQTPQNGSEGVISTDLCTLLRPHGRSHDPCESQQCTQMPQNGVEGAISTELCTLLCRHPGGEAHVAGAVTRPPTRTHEASAYGWLLSEPDRKPALPSRSGPHHLHRRNRPLSLRP